jgi:hypothetical protein
MGNVELLDCAGGLLDHYGYQLERGRGDDTNKYNKPNNIFYAKGASILLKRDVLYKTGLFDPDIFLYFDEVDLCWRIWLSGYKVIFAPTSIVSHASGSTASAFQQTSRQFHYAKNHAMILLKNYNLANMVKALAVTVIFEIRNVVVFLAKRKPLLGLSVLKGLMWNMVHLRETLTKRQHVQEIVRRVADATVKAQMLTPYPPFPLYVIFSRNQYEKRR